MTEVDWRKVEHIGQIKQQIRLGDWTEKPTSLQACPKRFIDAA